MNRRPLSLDFERFRRLPPGGDVWQLAVRVAPQWIVPDEDEADAPPPYRPLLAVCRSLGSGLVGMGEIGLPDAVHADLALGAITSLGTTQGIEARPAVVEVTDAALEAALGAALSDLGIEVRRVAALPEIDKFLVEMRHAIGSGDEEMYEPDVSIALLGMFAEAARAFEAAAPWKHLDSTDLVHVETPGAPEGMGWFAVMGATGISHGVAFFGSKRDCLEMMGSPKPSGKAMRTLFWSVLLFEPHMLPLVDHDRWEEHGLPRAAGGRIPVLAQRSMRGGGKRANAARLDFAAALLQVLATTTAKELAEGRWSRVLAGAAGGERTITLALAEWP